MSPQQCRSDQHDRHEPLRDQRAGNSELNTPQPHPRMSVTSRIVFRRHRQWPPPVYRHSLPADRGRCRSPHIPAACPASRIPLRQIDDRIICAAIRTHPHAYRACEHEQHHGTTCRMVSANHNPLMPASNPSRRLPAPISLATRDVVPAQARKTHSPATVSTIVEPTDRPANALSPVAVDMSGTTAVSIAQTRTPASGDQLSERRNRQCRIRRLTDRSGVPLPSRHPPRPCHPPVHHWPPDSPHHCGLDHFSPLWHRRRDAVSTVDAGRFIGGFIQRII